MPESDDGKFFSLGRSDVFTVRFTVKNLCMAVAYCTPGGREMQDFSEVCRKSVLLFTICTKWSITLSKILF